MRFAIVQPWRTDAVNDEDANKLDAYLGDGTYEKFDELDGDARQQLARAKAVEKMLWHYDTGFSVLAPYGTDWVGKVKNDFEVGFDLIKNSRFPDPAQFQQLFRSEEHTSELQSR